MPIQIRHRDSSLVVCTCDASTLRHQDFARNYLCFADFANRDVQGADFSGADLAHAVFNGANLEGAIFNGANLYHAEFAGAHLEGAHLAGVNLDQAHFRGARIGQHVLTRLVTHLYTRRGYAAIAFATEAGAVIVRAGCFTGTLAEARAYTSRTSDAQDDENRAICDFIETRARQMGVDNG